MAVVAGAAVAGTAGADAAPSAASEVSSSDSTCAPLSKLLSDQRFRCVGPPLVRRVARVTLGCTSVASATGAMAAAAARACFVGRGPGIGYLRAASLSMDLLSRDGFRVVLSFDGVLVATLRGVVATSATGAAAATVAAAAAAAGAGELATRCDLSWWMRSRPNFDGVPRAARCWSGELAFIGESGARALLSFLAPPTRRFFTRRRDVARRGVPEGVPEDVARGVATMENGLLVGGSSLDARQARKRNSIKISLK